MISIKKQMTKIIQQQPDDSTYEEILRELAFARMIARGLNDSIQKKTVSNNKIKQRIKIWQK